MNYICIDLGAANTFIGLSYDDNFETVERSTDLFLDDMEGTLEKISRGKDMDMIAIGSAGPIDEGSLRAYPPNIAVDHIDFKKELEDLGEIVLLNDCNAGAIGEYVYGSEDIHDIVYLAFGSGIGAGIIEDGKLLSGWRGNFGEVGHMKVGDDFRCGCGGTGHWESYCSGKNLPRVAHEITGKTYENPRETFEYIDAHTEEMNEFVELICKKNTIGLSNLINLYNPELISVGGKVALDNPEIYIHTPKDMIEGIINEMPEIRKTRLDRESTLYGLKAICVGDYEYRKKQKREGG